MKPCLGNRKPLALLSIGALETGREQTLRAHIEVCPACRDYLAEISNVAAQLRAVELNSEVRASDAFHRKTVAAMKAMAKKSVAESVFAQVQSLLNWRIALPAIGVAAVVIALVSTTAQRRGATFVAAPRTRTDLTPTVRVDLAPTVANYEMVANQSLEKLDELITLQGRRNPRSTPLYTASIISKWETSD